MSFSKLLNVTENDLHQHFDEWDKDKSGFIDQKELKLALM